MKITVSVDYYQEEDGYDGASTFTRDGVESLTDLAQFLANVVNGLGYNYVDDVCFLTDGGTEHWGFKL